MHDKGRSDSAVKGSNHWQHPNSKPDHEHGKEHPVGYDSRSVILPPPFFTMLMSTGKDNTSCPVEIGHQYCVLDWFVVTKVWAEMEVILTKADEEEPTEKATQKKANPKNTAPTKATQKKSAEKKATFKIVYKYRFEKLYIQERSWWVPEGSNETTPMIATPVKAPSEQCVVCKLVHTQIYEQQWTCLNPGCTEFHKVLRLFPSTVLTYSTAFLQERRPAGQIRRPFAELRPLPMSDEGLGNSDLSYFSRAMWKGFVCPKCYACNPRQYFDRWQCTTKGCSFTHALKMPLMGWKALLDDHSDGVYGHAASLDHYEAPFVKEITRIQGNWVINTFELSEGNFVTHFQANKAINAAPYSSNDLLLDVQREPLGLQRFPRKQETLKGPFLSSNFVSNFGLPYKYIVGVDCKGFSTAPKAIIAALQRLSWAGNRAVSGDCKEFNELLAVGYFDQGKMDVSFRFPTSFHAYILTNSFSIQYHDDGEKDLGPTVASLSLGGSATMTVRMKSKYYTGLTKGGNYLHEPILPGAWAAEKRKAFNLEYDAKIKQLPESERKLAVEKFHKSLGKRPTNCPALVTMKIAHGDMVIQHGHDLQAFYEHKVESTGKMRFALTARHIDPECENAKGQLEKGQYDASLVPAYGGTE